MKSFNVFLSFLLLLLSTVHAFVSDEDDFNENAYMGDIWVSIGGGIVLLIAIIAAVRFYLLHRAIDAAPIIVVETKISRAVKAPAEKKKSKKKPSFMDMR